MQRNVVRTIATGSSAAMSRILVGDKILTIDGASTQNLSTKEVQERLRKFVGQDVRFIVETQGRKNSAQALCVSGWTPGHPWPKASLANRAALKMLRYLPVSKTVAVTELAHPNDSPNLPVQLNVEARAVTLHETGHAFCVYKEITRTDEFASALSEDCSNLKPSDEKRYRRLITNRNWLGQEVAAQCFADTFDASAGLKLGGVDGTLSKMSVDFPRCKKVVVKAIYEITKF